MLSDFGQPSDGVVQTAYVVADIRASIRSWTDLLGVGPWFLQERWAGDRATYRGEPSTAEIAAALSFSGHTLIELIQPLDDRPSVYREVIEERGYGFHHVARASGDYDGDVARHLASGHELAFETFVPTGSRVAYMDTRSVLPGFIELIETTEANERFFTDIYRACLGWDGSDPLRAFG